MMVWVWGQLDGKELLNEEPDWRPAKNLRQAHANCPYVMGILAWDAWKVDQFALFCTRSLGPICLFEVKFRGSWRRLCGIFVICRGGAACWSARSTHFLECTQCVQPYRLHASMTVFPSICLHFYFLVCVFLYVFLFVFGLWVWVCLSSCLLDSFALIHSDLD